MAVLAETATLSSCRLALLRQIPAFPTNVRACQPTPEVSRQSQLTRPEPPETGDLDGKGSCTTELVWRWSELTEAGISVSTPKLTVTGQRVWSGGWLRSVAMAFAGWF